MRKKILIIKHGALGDIILASKSLLAIRKQNQDALIVVLTTKPYARFVVKTTQLVVFLNVPQKRNKVIRFADFLQRNKFTNQNLSASFTLFLITIYYEWKFKARVISIILWITFPVRKELPARPVRLAMDLGQTK